MHQIIAIGDSTLDVFLEIDEASVHCNLDKTKCFLCLNYADKIPVKKITRAFGGNSANFSVGTGRLGINTAIYTILGDDEVGKNIYEGFKKEKINTDYVSFDKNTTYSTVINFHGERTILTYHEPRQYNLPQLGDSEWVYLTSVSFDHENLHSQVIEYVKKSGAKLAFNPGVSQLRDGIDKLEAVLRLADILILNKDEAELLLGQKLVKELLNEFINKYQVKMAVITDAERGSRAFDGKTYFEALAEKATLVEMTGAGDAYAAGFMAAIIKGKYIQEAMRWGARNAASVVQHIGSQEGLLSNLETLKV